MVPATVGESTKPTRRERHLQTSEPRPPRCLPVNRLIEKVVSSALPTARDPSVTTPFQCDHTLQALHVEPKKTRRIRAIGAGRICVEVLCVHPAAVFGDVWWNWILERSLEKGSNAA